MYPRNAATPPAIAVGSVVQISDGAVQTTGASARVKTGTGAWGASAGTLTCDTTSGVWYYAPTQGETDAESFMVAVYKASCLPCTATVVTTASATAGYAGVDWGKVTSATSTVNLSGTTIKTATDVETDTADIQTRIPAALTGAGNIKADAQVVSDKTGYSISGTKTTLDALNDIPATDIVSGGAITTSGGRANANVVYWVDGAITEYYLVGVGQHLPAVRLSTDETGSHLTAIPWNASWDAEVQSECNDALVVLGLDHLVSASVAGTDITDNSIIAKLVSKSATADWDSYNNTTDSLEALLDRGDAAWVTATGFATSSALATAQSDLDILTGADGATLATSQPNYAPATAAALAVVDAIVDKVDTAMELDGAVYRFTTNALEQAPSGGGGDATVANQTTIITHLTDIKGATWSASTDTLEQLADAIAANPTASEIWAAITSAAANKIADHILRRSLASARASSDGDTVAFRSLIGAISKLVNKLVRSGATLTINEEDDATPFATQTIGTSANAEPIVSLDTN